MSPQYILYPAYAATWEGYTSHSLVELAHCQHFLHLLKNICLCFLGIYLAVVFLIVVKALAVQVVPQHMREHGSLQLHVPFENQMTFSGKLSEDVHYAQGTAPGYM